METEYRVTATQPYTYQTPEGHLVNGFRVWFTIPAFRETFSVDVPVLTREVVDKAVAPIVAGRKSLPS